jgi:hypothetical protein
MDFQKVIKELQDTLVVVSEIQRRQAEVQKLQAYEMDALREMFREGMKRHEEWRAHFEQSMNEAGNKLNGLVGYLDGLRRDKPE